MKVTKVETLVCSAGWRPWIFIKMSTDEGIVGYSECSESFGSPKGVVAAVNELGQHLVGQDPRAYEQHFWMLYRITRQSSGGVVQKAIAGLENAMLDIKAKALGVPVYELFGGPTRESIRLYWSHCGTTRVRNPVEVGKKPLKSLRDVEELGAEVREAGYTALKTNLLIPGREGFSVLQQGFRGGIGTTDQILTTEVRKGLEQTIAAFRKGAGDGVDLLLDVNFNFKSEGNVSLARALEPYNLMWFEVDCFHADALRTVKDSISTPVCSGENLFTNRGYRPFIESRAMDIASVDILWNGVAQSKKIADLAELHEMNVAPHNHYSHLATLISAHFCAAVPNVRILEVDVDDVPWREELLTKPISIKNGTLTLPREPGWGADLNEEVIRAHPWQK